MTSTGSPYLLDNAGADAPARLSALASMSTRRLSDIYWAGAWGRGGTASKLAAEVARSRVGSRTACCLTAG